MPSSTSGHRLNADRPLGAIGKARYFLHNALNNARPYADVDPRLGVRPFVYAEFERRWNELTPGASPSRTLSDLFWMALPWERIRAALGEIHVLDTGCGSGSYGPRMLAWSGDRIASYTGTDAQPHAGWHALEAKDARLHFFASRAEDFRRQIPAATTMFVSQSAIEHFDEDLTFFDQIRDFIAERDRPVLQVHLVPSSACLYLYQLHGVRQYTPRTLSRATRLFPNATRHLFGLGGRAANRLHHEFVTWPLLVRRRADLRTAKPEEYDRRLRAAIAEDMRTPQPSPAFWALVIESGFETSIF